MSKHLTAEFGVCLLAGAGVLLLAGCKDEVPKTALQFKPVEQVPQQVVGSVPGVQPVTQFAVQSAPKVAVAPAAPVAAIKPQPKVVPRVAKPAPAPVAVKPVEKVAVLKPASTIPAAPEPKVEQAPAKVAELPKRAEPPMPVVTQVQIHPAPVTTQPTAPMSWLKPFEFKGVSAASAPSVVERPMTYEPRPNPYANAYVPQATPQTVQPVALQAPGVNFGALSPISYDPTHSLADFLPSIKKVHPTGEKPLVVVSFKCPTEGMGIATPTTKILHSVIDTAFGGVNATNVLPWNLQQVCS